MTDATSLSPADDIGAAAPRPKRRWPWIAAVMLLLLVGTGLYNAVIWRPVSAALADEREVSLVAYRQWLVSPNTAVIDIRNVASTASMADVDRSLFKAAEALKDRQFDSVILAYHGKARLMIDALAFQTIGQERAFQNPIYVIRTMQQDVKTLDGAAAFPELHGGWLGVLGAEMDQHKEFHERWWLSDALAHSGAAE